MAQFNNVLDNQNYINKDFQQIYVELLDTIKKLSNKWMVDEDSNESDPIILLIKELAALGDKCNYNSDKNMLENFPKTVQQEIDARELFDCVYKMSWFRAASGSINIKNISGEGTDIAIPPFTMFSNSDNTTIYTVVDFISKNIKDGGTESFNVLQGSIEDYSYQGNKIITLDKLLNNRVYFEDYNVAENGIFVFDKDYLELDDSLKGITDAAQWKMVDNFYVEPVGTKCFEFNIDVQTGTPYIEFPDYVEELIGSGLIIKYIKTEGAEGNIGIRQVNTLYKAPEGVTIDKDKISIANTAAIDNGYNPESIEDGYKGYMKNINVCKTLVTLRDYINTIYLGKNNEGKRLVSNVIVSDKTNDIQSSYMVEGVSTVEKDTDKEAMSCFDLKFYGLTPIEDSELTNLNSYKTTFSLINCDTIPEDVEDYIEETKHIQHNFKTIRETNRICLIKNYYNLKITPVYKYALQQSQIEEVQYNIQQALIKALNAREINFADRIQYKEVIDIIVNCDSRISACTVSGLDDDDFSASAVFWTPREQVATVVFKDPSDNIQTTDEIVYRSFEYKNENITETDKLYRWDENSKKYIPKAATAEDGDYSDTESELIRVKSNEATWTPIILGGALPKEGLGDYCSLSIPSDDFEEDVDIIERYSAKAYQLINKGAEAFDEVPEGYIYKDSENKYWIRELENRKKDVSSLVSRDKTISPKFFSGPILKSNVLEGGGGVENGYYYIGRNAQNLTYYYCLTYGINPTTAEGNVSYFYKTNNYGFYCANQKGSFQELKISLTDKEFGDLDLTSTEGEKLPLVKEFQKEIITRAALNHVTPLYKNLRKFDITVKDTLANTIEGVGYVSPELKLDLGGSYDLKKNENVQIIQPGFTDVDEYTFYVWVGYVKDDISSARKTIAANQSYKIQKGEHVFVYYRSDDNTNYNYVRYDEGKIICPDIALELTSTPTSYSWQKAYVNKSARGTTNEVDTKTIEKSTSLYSTDKLALIDGKHTLTVKEPLEVKLHESKTPFTLNYYISKPNTSLFEERTEPGVDYYTLDTDDMVILDGSVMLESGTVIKREVDENGAKAISSAVTIEVGDTTYGKLSYFTCDIIQLSEGSNIRVASQMKVDDTIHNSTYVKSDAIPVIINSDASALNVNFEVLDQNYNPGDPNYNELFNTINEAIKAYGASSGYLYTVYVKGTNGVTIGFKVSCVAVGTGKLSLTNEFKNIKDEPIRLYYTLSDGDAEKELFLNDPEFVNIRSVLSLNIGPSTEQKLEDNQSVSVYDTHYNEILSVGKDNYLLANESIETYGGKYQNVQVVGKAINIYTKQTIQPPEEPTIKYNSDGVIMYFDTNPGELSSREIELNLQSWASFYIVKIQSSIGNLEDLSAYLDDTRLSDMYGNKDFSDGKIHYLKLGPGNVPTVCKLKFTAKPRARAEQGSVYIDNYLIPYGESVNSNIAEPVTNQMKTLDYEYRYDYTIDVDKSREIDNPLNAASFFNSNHPYNKVMICEMSNEAEIK